MLTRCCFSCLHMFSVILARCQHYNYTILTAKQEVVEVQANFLELSPKLSK